MTWPVMRKGLCFILHRKHYKKARYKKSFAREMKRVGKILMSQ